MANRSKIKVRPLISNDINFIADYWLLSQKDYLVGMGVDLRKLPSRDGLTNMLRSQINLPDSEKTSLAMVLEVDGQPSGHCNVNDIRYGHDAKMHLHLWKSNNREKGLGTEMVKKSLPEFFNRLELKAIFCEPYALNPAPPRTLIKVGFEFVKKYKTVPGSLNFEQEVNQYKLTKKKFEEKNEIT